MDGSDERNVGDGGASARYAIAGAFPRSRAGARPTVDLAQVGNRPTGPLPPPEPEPATESEAGPPRPRRPTLTTAAVVCVIAASLAVVGWINWRVGESSPPAGRYSVVDPPPDADGLRPPAVPASPPPLVPLLPAHRASGDSRTGSPSRKPPTAPSARATTPQPTRAVTGPAGVIAGYAGKCLHAPGDKPADGTPVVMTACDGGAADRWIMASDGTVRTSGKCLEVAGAQVADGATVQVSTCDGAPGQKWRFTGGRDLTNPHADKCLDVRDFNTAEGALAQIWTCTGGPNQKWSIPA